MTLSKKLTLKHEKKVQQSKENLKRAKRELSKAVSDYNLVSRIVGNTNKLKEMSDLEVRKHNLPGIIASDCNKILLEDYAFKGDIIDYDISERFYELRGWLVKKHDRVYDVIFGGEMGAMTGKSLKKGHSPEEFDDGVWDVLKGWIRQYRNRMMKEELYKSIMHEDFNLLYSGLVNKRS